MQPLKNAFSFLQKIGKSLMLPVSVLPIAGILLGVGSAGFAAIPPVISKVMAEAGGAIFGNLPLIFAIGVSLGLTGNDGVAALAGTIGYAVLLATMGVVASPADLYKDPIMGFKTIQSGVFGGIVAGTVAALLFNRYFRVKLPPWLSFFSGKRLVPILTAVASIGLGIALSFLWPPIGHAIAAFSKWASQSQPAVAFGLYGAIERALLPFGLHHIWNVPFFFEAGKYIDPATGKEIVGELYRFTAGDPTAGNLAGGYLFKMWGLPAAAIAIWHCARPEQKARVGGLMVSAALTSFLTGITEPIEFSFLFVAPALYALHALLAASAFPLCIALGIKHGTTFSHGLIDYLVLFPKSSHALWLLVVGPLYALAYYLLFRTMIRAFDLKTPGREAEADPDAAAPSAAHGVNEFARRVVLALGGRANLKTLDACITRLRVEVHDRARVSERTLKSLGASGVMSVGSGVQAIFGTRSENLKTDIEEYLRTSADDGPAEEIAAGPEPHAAPTGFAAPETDPHAAERTASWLASLGGTANVSRAECVAATRLRIALRDPRTVDAAALLRDGIHVVPVAQGIVHLLVGPSAPQYALELNARLGAPPRV